MTMKENNSTNVIEVGNLDEVTKAWDIKSKLPEKTSSPINPTDIILFKISADVYDIKERLPYTTKEYKEDVVDGWKYIIVNNLVSFTKTGNVNSTLSLRNPNIIGTKIIEITKISIYFNSTNSKNVTVDIITSYSNMVGYERVYSTTANTSRSIVIPLEKSGYKYPSHLLGGVMVSTSNGTSTDTYGVMVTYVLSEDA